MTAEEYLISSGFTEMGIVTQKLDERLIDFAKYHANLAFDAGIKYQKSEFKSISHSIQNINKEDFLKTIV